MAKISIRQPEELVAVVVRDMVPPERHGDYTEDELATVATSYFPHADEDLELGLFSMPPHAVAEPHAHTAPEIFYVTAGSVHFGAQVCGPGSAIFVGEMVLYGFRAGPEGASFLAFRGETGSRIVSKDEYLTERGADSAES